MIDSLWGDDFNVEEKVKTKKIIAKVTKEKTDIDTEKTTEKHLKNKKVSIEDKLKIIEDKVYTVLSKQKENVLVITKKEDLHNYLDKAISFGRISIDTETNNSLDPITCKLMGLCLYVKGEKQVYVPVNHINIKTGEKLVDQLSEQDINEELTYFLNNSNNVVTVFHNGKFDYEVIKCTCKVSLPITWDTMIGSKLLDENEKAGLKEQYINKIDPEQEKYSIDKLFDNIEYQYVDPNLFALYAATDALMTDRLYEWQINEFNKKENSKLLEFAKNLEMPEVEVIAEMELAGMEVDQQYAELLSKKYNNELSKIDIKISEELTKLDPQIKAWKLTPEANEAQKKRVGEGSGKSKAEQLEDPINMGSPTQVAILFYDILKCPQVSKKSPRGTGEVELNAIYDKLKLPICKLLLERRELLKLIKTYIETIPAIAKKWPDGRVRTHFNQYGADTGRLSSGGRIVFGLNDEWGGVNFQNIPSHNKEIRMLFKAKEGYKIIGSDYSAQEPRLTAFYSQDDNMIKAYQEGKDLYATIAAMSFDRKYEDCLEFYPEGTEIVFEGQKIICGNKTHQNKEGKTYRTMAKSILLGVLYGRGAASVGEQIGKSREEAQEIIDKFFKAFPKVKKWIDQSINDARKYGYVEDVAGRRRRLPDILLPKYKITDLSEKENSNFNPFLICKDRLVENKLIEEYRKKLDNLRSRKDYERIQQEALANNIEIHDNTGFIAQAERQAVNSRVQGGAATLTKQALLDIYRDKKLKDMGAYLVNTVHDEILIEAPDKYMKEAADRLVEIMINSARKYVTNVPMSCDPYITNVWYLDEFSVTVRSEFKHMIESGLDPMQAFEDMCEYRTESTRDQLYELVGEYLPQVPDNVNTSYKSLTE